MKRSGNPSKKEQQSKKTLKSSTGQAVEVTTIKEGSTEVVFTKSDSHRSVTKTHYGRKHYPASKRVEPSESMKLANQILLLFLESLYSTFNGDEIHLYRNMTLDNRKQKLRDLLQPAEISFQRLTREYLLEILSRLNWRTVECDMILELFSNYQEIIKNDQEFEELATSIASRYTLDMFRKVVEELGMNSIPAINEGMRSCIMNGGNEREAIFQYLLDHYYPQFLDMVSAANSPANADDYFYKNFHYFLLKGFVPQVKVLVEERGLSTLFEGKKLVELNEVTLEGIKYVFEKGLMTFTEEDLYHYFTWPNSIPGGMIDVLLYLIDALPFNPNYTNKDGNGWYSFGNISLNLQIIGKLMDKGVPVNHQNKKGETPLMRYARHFEQQMDFLLSRPEGLATLNMQDNDGNTALMRLGKELWQYSIISEGENYETWGTEIDYSTQRGVYRLMKYNPDTSIVNKEGKNYYQLVADGKKAVFKEADKRGGLTDSDDDGANDADDDE